MDKVLEHLQSRGMNPHLYGVHWDDKEACVPLREFNGRFVGVLRYSPWGDKKSKNPDLCKYKPSAPSGVTPLFGLETLAYEGPVFFVEGVFKACALHNLGYAALAVLGSDSSRVRNQVWFMRQFRRVVFVGDNDKAGEKFAKSMGGVTSPLDLDEMSPSELQAFVKEVLNGNYCY